MKTRKSIQGFSLIELMIAVALLAIFLVMASPSIRTYLENSKVKNVAESIESGMQKARFNAINHNHLTQFVMTARSGAGNNDEWIIREQIPPTPPNINPTAQEVETFVWGSGGSNWTTVNAPARDSGNGAANAVTFDGMGKIVSNTNWTAPTTATTGPAASANRIAQVQVSSSTGMTEVAQMNVNVGVRGIRVCSPSLPTTDPKYCNAATIE
ncbi:MAG: prepilin-type N-terminal cleavage/methylation domain-containing protein [Burkholderiales bacterium]|jgi:type IV fimbrial biogenesis protein FimT|nr:prepilin-type N-terminal cleavage/methylation domain-containing protein [Burkholderiales bacterium]